MDTLGEFDFDSLSNSLHFREAQADKQDFQAIIETKLAKQRQDNWSQEGQDEERITGRTRGTPTADTLPVYNSLVKVGSW